MAPSTSKKHFCCVLPLRVSVLVLGTISVVLSGALSGALYYFAFQTTSKSIPHLTGSAKTAVIVLAVAMTVVFICSIIGIIGDILSLRKLVEVYAISHWITLIVKVVVGIYATKLLFKFLQIEPDLYRVTIKDDLTGPCAVSANAVKAAWLTLFIVDIFAHLHACIVIHQYVRQLKQTALYSTAVDLAAAPASVPLMDVVSDVPLTAPSSTGHTMGERGDVD